MSKYKYVDLVVVNHPDDDRDFLYLAPRWSGLEQGDEVICDSETGARPAVVRRVCTVEIGGDQEVLSMLFYLAKVNEKPIHRVLSKVEVRDLTWEAEDDTLEH